ncbi:hypothetical protein F383_34996 [Gossypium arboreum]|uniref:Secreted protein n=1 Tax=Gossypium arboreum TaxID=29729 RepID=A0A0B0N5Y9_GOSAR|nr:hypothetical protein F383_34996 [Gossypium arboreum]
MVHLQLEVVMVLLMCGTETIRRGCISIQSTRQALLLFHSAKMGDYWPLLQVTHSKREIKHMNQMQSLYVA